MRTLVVSDDPTERDTLKKFFYLLCDTPHTSTDSVAAKCVENADDLLAVHDSLDRIVLCVDEPDASVGDLFTAIRAQRPAIHLGLVVSSIDRATLECAMRWGSNGVFMRPIETVETLFKLRRWLDGAAQWPEDCHSDCAVGEPPMPLRSLTPIVPLTPRQVDVLRLINEGKTNREIAELLNCMINTVHSHCQGIYRAIGVGNRVQASHWLEALTG